MKIAIIGTGYVGLPTGVGFAELGHTVVCVDKIKEKIDQLKSGQLTLYEDGLNEMFIRNLQNGHLSFTTSMHKAIKGADVVLIAVGTPPHPVTQEADLKYIYAAATELAEYLTDYTVVATKSTVPVGTGDDIEQLILQKNPTARFDVISLPEFLREGLAIHDFFNPDRIVVGTDSEKAIEVMKKLYEPFLSKTEILFVSRRSSETIKYASNAFLAMKIQYINEMADFCEKTGADVAEVAQGMGLDKRIGKSFLNAGIGFGGSCFPKDTKAMAFMGRKVGVSMDLIETTINGNQKRREKLADRVCQSLKDETSPKIAVWGLAFKNDTDDCRESPAIDVINVFLDRHMNVVAYDPKAMQNACRVFGDRISYADDMYAAVKDADALVILTEWKVFASVDLKLLAQLMRKPRIFDYRNMLDSTKASDAGIVYECIGRKAQKNT